jgi:hypothetical protein
VHKRLTYHLGDTDTTGEVYSIHRLNHTATKGVPSVGEMSESTKKRYDRRGEAKKRIRGKEKRGCCSKRRR